MFHNKRVLAVIPARSGSKRLPDKNILDLCGKPLIAWSIEAGLESRYVDRVILSTDDKDIADTGAQCGADVPFLRPDALAADDSRTIDTLIYIVKRLHDEGEDYDYLLLLQPTSPLRNSTHIDQAFDILDNSGTLGVVSVCAIEHPVEWTNTLPPNGSMDGFLNAEYVDKRSQDFAQRYLLNGAIYLVNVRQMLEEGTVFLKTGIVACIMQRSESIDIDCMDDFLMAEYLIKCRQSS